MTKDTSTLREALSDFHTQNYKITANTEALHNAEAFYTSHDIAHVVFGCDTSMLGEGTVKLWTIFGTTLGFKKHIRAYSEANAFDVFKQYSWAHVLKNVFKVIVVAPAIVIRARKMSKKWPWSSYDTYLDVSISEIRKEFNIDPLAV